MAFRPYLAFDGDCRAAFTRYHEIFGGDVVVLSASDMPADAGDPPPANQDGVMHAALMIGDQLLMGADDLSGSFNGNVTGMCVNWNAPDAGEAKRVFDALAEGGSVQMPTGETFFSPAYGMCTDRYGTPWMIMVDGPAPG